MFLRFALFLMFILFLFVSPSYALDLTSVPWMQLEGLPQWHKYADDSTVYFVRRDEEFGTVYGIDVTCPEGSVKESDVTVFVFVPEKMAILSSRTLCDGKDDTPAIHLWEWGAIVGNLPDELGPVARS